jgi:hypothetical protein
LLASLAFRQLRCGIPNDVLRDTGSNVRCENFRLPAAAADRKEPPLLTKSRFNHPRFSPAGEERIRRAMQRGHRGDDPRLPIRQLSVRRGGNDFISWVGPVDHGCPEPHKTLWEMEIDLDRFRARRRRAVPGARKA